MRQIWAGIFPLALFAFLVNGLFVIAELKLLAWHRGWRAAVLGG